MPDVRHGNDWQRQRLLEIRGQRHVAGAAADVGCPTGSITDRALRQFVSREEREDSEDGSANITLIDSNGQGRSCSPAEAGVQYLKQRVFLFGAGPRPPPGSTIKRFFRCDKSAPMPVRMVRQHYFGAGRIEFIGTARARLYAPTQQVLGSKECFYALRTFARSIFGGDVSLYCRRR